MINKKQQYQIEVLAQGILGNAFGEVVRQPVLKEILIPEATAYATVTMILGGQTGMAEVSCRMMCQAKDENLHANMLAMTPEQFFTKKRFIDADQEYKGNRARIIGMVPSLIQFLVSQTGDPKWIDGTFTIGDLIKLTERQLFKARGFSSKTLVVMDAVLKHAGIPRLEE